MQPNVLRIQERAQFQAVMSCATVARTVHFALHRMDLAAMACDLPKPVGAEPAKSVAPLFATRAVWVGAMVPKRWAKRAVTRNAIKRQIYAVTAGCASRLPVAALVVRLRAGFAKDQFPSAASDALKTLVRGELQQLLAKVTAS